MWELKTNKMSMEVQVAGHHCEFRRVRSTIVPIHVLHTQKIYEKIHEMGKRAPQFIYGSQSYYTSMIRRKLYKGL